MKVNNEFLNKKISQSPYSINEICELLDVSRISCWKYRKGKVPYKTDQLLKLIDLLNLDINDVFIKTT
ncbi:hypothetical protein [Paraclostridium tenue]|uniref:XRE family transcriptional regulator n=1 Tax=Paraclostridium tenue TaxID=1737 RepID=A0ABN1M2X4_9FIRM|nr:hypothetical protein [[Eubacterium] tenue]